jgi:hypothetical protein
MMINKVFLIESVVGHYLSVGENNLNEVFLWLRPSLDLSIIASVGQFEMFPEHLKHCKRLERSLRKLRNMVPDEMISKKLTLAGL